MLVLKDLLLPLLSTVIGGLIVLVADIVKIKINDKISFRRLKQEKIYQTISLLDDLNGLNIKMMLEAFSRTTEYSEINSVSSKIRANIYTYFSDEKVLLSIFDGMQKELGRASFNRMKLIGAENNQNEKELLVQNTIDSVNEHISAVRNELKRIAVKLAS